jgi:hypothetical protein
MVLDATAGGGASVMGETIGADDAWVDGATVGGGTTPVCGVAVDTDAGDGPSSWIGSAGTLGGRSSATTAQ